MVWPQLFLLLALSFVSSLSQVIDRYFDDKLGGVRVKDEPPAEAKTKRKSHISLHFLVHYKLQSKARNTHLLRLQIFRLPAVLVHSLFMVPSRPAPGPANWEIKQSVNRRNIHHLPNQHMHFFRGERERRPHYQKLYTQVTNVWRNRRGLVQCL